MPSHRESSKATTTTISIVFAIGTDPVAMGLVVAKRLGKLRELAPGTTASSRWSTPTLRLLMPLSKSYRRALRRSDFQSKSFAPAPVAKSFANLVQKLGAALWVAPDAVFTSRRALLALMESANRGLERDRCPNEAG
jgi:hypothetical protein